MLQLMIKCWSLIKSALADSSLKYIGLKDDKELSMLNMARTEKEVRWDVYGD